MRSEERIKQALRILRLCAELDPHFRSAVSALMWVGGEAEYFDEFITSVEQGLRKGEAAGVWVVQ